MLRFNLHTYRNVDAAQVVAVINAASRASGVAFTITEKELAARQAAPGFDIDRDTSIVEAPGQGVIAYAEANLRQADDCIYYLTQAWVHPRFCGQGIGHALLERMWQQLQDICTVAEHKPGVLGAAVQDSQANAMKLFEKFSMRAVRYFNLMQRDLSLPIPPVELASGIRMCSWAERRNDQAIWAAHGEAFEDHWMHIPEPYEAFEHRVRSGRFSLEGSFVLWDGDLVAGGTLNEMGPAAAARRGNNMGYVGSLFVRRPWRSRGLGKALLVASMLKAKEFGHDLVGLTVDSENLSGAVRLYESVGFYTAVRRIAYFREYPGEL